MGRSLAIFVSLTFLSGVFVVGAWAAALRLARAHDQPQQLRWLVPWSIKGLAVPLLLWALMNFGLSFELQPFMPEVQAAQYKGGAWFPVFLRVLACGLFVLSSYWAALTLGWTLYQAGQGLEEGPRKNFQALCWTWGLGLLLPALLVVFIGGWPVLGVAAAVVLVPIASYAPGTLELEAKPPMYARAVAKMKFGKYTEAEWEIIRELEKCNDDFEGWMMLAELYANQFNDLPEAERTVLELCDNPKTTVSQVSIALHRLADWHLKLAANPSAARRALAAICHRCRGTHLARMAQLRLQQLPLNREELRDQQNSKAIPLPALGDQFDQAPAQPDSILERHKAAELASQCVDRLKQDPNYAPAREKLARLWAERLDKVDLALGQLELLLKLPEPTESQRAEWLSLMAAWHLKYRLDEGAARTILERLLREFPRTPQAFSARRRLQLMAAQRRAQAVPRLPARKSIRLTDGEVPR